MAWTANITGKTYNSGTLNVTVAYSNGVSNFSEPIDLTGGDTTVLNTKIQGRLNTLNTTDAASTAVPTGPITPTVTPSSQQLFITALRRFQSCQRGVSLGIIATTDKVYTDAFTNLKTLYDPTLVDSI